MTRNRALHRLRIDNHGAAVVEFALAFPVLLTLGLGVLELAHFVLATERINQIAQVVADNASRVGTDSNTLIDEADVNEVMLAGKFVGQNINFAQHGRIILSSVQQNAAGNGQWIRWQRCSGVKNVVSTYTVDMGKSDSSLPYIGTASQQFAASDGNAIMYVEIYYDYQPLAKWLPFVSTRTMSYNTAYKVRARIPAGSSAKDITNQQNLPTAQTASCTLFTA